MIPVRKENGLDLDDLIIKPVKNRLFRVGIELEGAWNTFPNGTAPIRDGSLDDWTPPPKMIKGEIPSPPLDPSRVEEWMRLYWPHRCDHHKCGLHVHMSLRSALAYQRLMTPTYPSTILKYVDRWAQKNLPIDHHIWPRLRGENTYCQHVYQAAEQVKNRRKDFLRDRVGHRYTMVNYSYSNHSTVEVRLLPMMPTVDLGVDAVKLILHVTNAFLVKTARKEKWEGGAVDIGPQEPSTVRQIII